MAFPQSKERLREGTINRVLARLDMGKVKWAKSALPTLASLDDVQSFIAPELVEAVTCQEKKETPLEKARGRGVSVVIKQHSTVKQAAAMFDELIAQAVHAPRTRCAYFRSWRTFVTFAISMNALALVMPADPELVKAFILAMVTVGLKAGTILATVSAINHRHMAYGYAIQVHPMMLKSWSKAIKRCLRQPHGEKFRVMPVHLQMVLRLPRTTLLILRDTCMFVLGTICSLRCGEIPDLDVCNLMFNIDGPGTLALHIKWRKNDAYSKGLWPRIGMSRDRALCVIALIREWL